jgi:enoyl-CoA hydratase/carnithine racemase
VIRVVREGEIAVIALNRPEQRNALTPDMFDSLSSSLDEIPGDPQTGAIVLAGEGKAFCGGFDLRLCLAKPGTLEILLKQLYAMISRLAALPLPLVIAAHGAAIAGGCALLSAADVVITNDSARIGYPVTPLGISPAVSGASLGASVGRGPARTRMLDPGLIGGRESVRIGLTHESQDEAELVRPRAMEVARALSCKPRWAYAATKAWLQDISAAGAPQNAPDRALAASVSIAGGEEERQRLARFLR